jgi:hypothetical protein
MKRVIVLGSKPGAAFLPGDAVYAANAALGFYTSDVKHYPTTVNVVSALVLSKSFADAAGIYGRKWRAVADATPSRMVLFAAPDTPGCTAAVCEALTAGGYAAPIEICSVRDRIELVTSVTSLRYPIVTAAVLGQPLATLLDDARRLARFAVRRRHQPDASRDCETDAPGKFRPSTGILALLVAIRDHGPNAEYVLAGIGLAGRNLHQAAGGIVAGKDRSRGRILPPHICADIAVLKALRGRYRLRTTEPELEPLVAAVPPDRCHPAAALALSQAAL